MEHSYGQYGNGHMTNMFLFILSMQSRVGAANLWTREPINYNLFLGSALALVPAR